ncbi:MAG: DNA polymerase III subunit delta [Ruminococcaceae bacterium]|nr:DNA polymerase III subunit delta [Oscillospiraceae bacterium]
MAVIFEEAFKKTLQAEKLLPVYILFGEDSYLKKNYTEKIAALITETDDIFNFAKFTKDSALQEVYDSVMQFPFMSDKKCVILDDFDFEDCSKTDFENLVELISSVPDTTVFVLVFESVQFDHKKNQRFKKMVTAAEKIGGAAVNLAHRSVAELSRMLCDGAKKRGVRMDSSVARYLIEVAGEDINLLRNELYKLCAYCKNGVILKEDVDNVSVKTIEASVYNLSKHIFDCNISSAINLLDELMFMKLEPMSVFYSISSCYVDMQRIFAARKQGVGITEVAEHFGYGNKAFLLEKAAQSLKKFNETKLNLSFDELIKADKRLKSTGADQRTVLEELIVRLVYIIAKGDSVDKA